MIQAFQRARLPRMRVGFHVLVAIIHQGRIVTAGALEDLRSGSESLEDAFVRVVGAGGRPERLEWL